MTSPSIGVIRDPKVRYAHEHRTIRVLTSLRGNDSEDNSRTSSCNQHLGDLALAQFLLGVIQSSALLSLWPPYALVAMARRRMQSDAGEAVIRRDVPVGTLQAETPDWLFLLRPLIALVAFNTRLWPHWVGPE